ncbi:MAG: hypothetical protein Q7J32_01025 [Sphingomonadaceae bacterium]|nr:hypothetical protein [Sphingomonadaceae bacterium]
MAFLDLNAPPSFGTRQSGVVVHVHPEWRAVADQPAAAPAPRWKRGLVTVGAIAIAAAVHFWSAAALDSHLLGLATTGIVAAMALSLLTGARR